jgi:hypothetical protein
LRRIDFVDSDSFPENEMALKLEQSPAADERGVL